ncbi:hypothetical protein C480_21629 [Natrialba aegyptia DSM 13077]|uniref:Uncharacterized protein n=1 Tax=Natrialba aegyptia DSM 13077 TaxID=1227491 RepID=M0AIT5_9EURY|nr:hypothetical protein C480_21629 [Natrialba aegyptia DSM 13077]
MHLLDGVVDAVTLARWIQVVLVAVVSERRREHLHDLDRLVINDSPLLSIPEDWRGDATSILRVSCCVDFVEEVRAVYGIRRTAGFVRGELSATCPAVGVDDGH